MSAEYANMSSTTLVNMVSNGSKSRPQPASPPLQHAPPLPPSLNQANSGLNPPPIIVGHPPQSHPSSLSVSQQQQQQPHPSYQRNFVRSPTVTSMATPTPLDDELLAQFSPDELISRLKTIEARNRKLLFDNGAMMKDINMHLSQLQQLKQQNFQLIGDNNELRDLCCYLDDERSKVRSVAREWQSFGTHMSRVMRHEVATYSSKLSQLETKQFELVRENFELKQLCLLLDNAISIRENGDGSTGSMASTSEEANGDDHANNNGQPTTRPNPQRSHHRVIISQQILEYIRSLEGRIQQLEWEKKRVRPPTSSDLNSNADTMDSSYDAQTITNGSEQGSNVVHCPPAVAEAMRVLRIHDESLNDDTSRTSKQSRSTDPRSPQEPKCPSEDISLEQQRAIVRSLCNVAWRKIEDGT